MIGFVCIVFLVACAVKFIRTLAMKWGVLEWLQVNAPCEFFHKLFTCEFCQSFHLGMIICAVLAILWQDAWLLLVPIFSSVVRW